MNSESSTQYTAIYNRKPIYRGDTLDPLRITITDDIAEAHLIPVALCVQIRNSSGKLVTQVGTSVDVETGQVLIEAVPPEVTRTFFPGVYRYDVEYTMPDGRVRTYVSGEITVLRDVSVCH